MITLHASTFDLDYELPLNKRFIRKFKEMFQAEGFVITDSLPHDNVTIFGKSQPDVIVYRSDSNYINGRSVMSVTFSVGMVCEIAGATMEFKKSEVCHLKFKSPQLAQLCANMVRMSVFLM